MPTISIGLVGLPTLAYLGPGAGLSAVGALLAVCAAIVVALFGFVWYPLRRLMRAINKDAPAGTAPQGPEPATTEPAPLVDDEPITADQVAEVPVGSHSP